MKFIFALLVLTPLVYCATLTHEEQLIIQAMTEEEKRALVNLHMPSLHDVRIATCRAMAVSDKTCAAACKFALQSIPYGSLAGAICAPVCNTIHC